MARTRALAGLLLLAPGLAQAGASPPLATLMSGTVQDATQASTSGTTTSFCLLNASLPPGAASFSDHGPSVSFYQQDIAGGPLTIAMPGLGHATQISGQAPAWDFYAAGTMRLVFSTSTSGTIAALPGGVWVPSTSITPMFSQFATAWNPATSQLSVSFMIALGNCSVNFLAVYGS